MQCLHNTPSRAHRPVKIRQSVSVSRDPRDPSPWAPRPPSRDQVAEKFAALVEGAESREEVDRWAAQWVAAVDAGVEDEAIWWGLGQLCGVDARHGPDAPYLHTTEQIAEWLAEFRERCART